MLQNVKIASDAIIFSLFDFTLPTLSPVFAKNIAVFVECQKMKCEKGSGNRHRQIESGGYPESVTGPRKWSGSRSTLVRGTK